MKTSTVKAFPPSHHISTLEPGGTSTSSPDTAPPVITINGAPASDIVIDTSAAATDTIYYVAADIFILSR